MQRAGHDRFETTRGYVRTAEAVRDGFGSVFPPLPASLFGSSTDDPRSSGGSRNRGSTRMNRPANRPKPSHASGTIAERAGFEIAPASAGRSQRMTDQRKFPWRRWRQVPGPPRDG